MSISGKSVGEFKRVCSSVAEVVNRRGWKRLAG